MHTQPSMLAKTVRWFAETMSPHADSYTDDPDLWLDVFLKLDHDVQLELLNDERKRTKENSALRWNRVKPSWMR
jgi:hypothetical protein